MCLRISARALALLRVGERAAGSETQASQMWWGHTQTKWIDEQSEAKGRVDPWAQPDFPVEIHVALGWTADSDEKRWELKGQEGRWMKNGEEVKETLGKKQNHRDMKMHLTITPTSPWPSHTENNRSSVQATRSLEILATSHMVIDAFLAVMSEGWVWEDVTENLQWDQSTKMRARS